MANQNEYITAEEYVEGLKEMKATIRRMAKKVIQSETETRNKKALILVMDNVTSAIQRQIDKFKK